MSAFGCPHCGCKMIEPGSQGKSVTKSIPVKVIVEGKLVDAVRRLRKCRYCGLSYKTTEIVDVDPDQPLAPVVPAVLQSIDHPQRNPPPPPDTLTNPFI